jgi:hypothetical protein
MRHHRGGAERELLDQRQRAGMGWGSSHRAFGDGGSLSRLHRGWHPAQCCDISQPVLPKALARPGQGPPSDRLARRQAVNFQIDYGTKGKQPGAG